MLSIGPSPDILVIKNPALADSYRFEWHPRTKRVYVIRLHSTPLMGEPIAMGIGDMGAATNAVLIWSRGYREAKAAQALQKVA